MTMQQWDKHQQHMDEHITWPATKQEILEACQGTDVEAGILDEVRAKLSDSGKKYTEAEAKNILVS